MALGNISFGLPDPKTAGVRARSTEQLEYDKVVRDLYTMWKENGEPRLSKDKPCARIPVERVEGMSSNDFTAVVESHEKAFRSAGRFTGHSVRFHAYEPLKNDAGKSVGITLVVSAQDKDAYTPPTAEQKAATAAAKAAKKAAAVETPAPAKKTTAAKK